MDDKCISCYVLQSCNDCTEARTDVGKAMLRTSLRETLEKAYAYQLEAFTEEEIMLNQQALVTHFFYLVTSNE